MQKSRPQTTSSAPLVGGIDVPVVPYASLLSTLAAGATTTAGRAYLSRPNPREIVASNIADEKKYGDDTPSESKHQPNNNRAMMRATPLLR